MLARKLLWTAISALALLAARRVAERVFRIVAGEEPPVRR
jgi:hypothetical protein